jgi:arginine/lysine/ornithine decarboxylase
MESYGKRLAEFRERLEDLSHLTVAIPDGWTAGVNADPSKILIRGRNAQISGEAVMEHLRQQAHLELEMATPTYALAMTSLMDTEEGFNRLEAALRRMDTEEITTKQPLSVADVQRLYEQPRQVAVPLGIAKDKTTTRVALSGAAGAIAGGFVNLYPPGIPVFAPGEVLEEAGLAAVARAMEAGFAVDGIEEQTIEILDE